MDGLCCMRPLIDALATARDKVLYVFYDFETTKNTRYATLLHYTYLSLSVRNNSAHSARTWKTGLRAIRQEEALVL